MPCDGRDCCLVVEADQTVASGTVAVGGWLLALRPTYLLTMHRKIRLTGTPSHRVVAFSPNP